MRKSKYVFFYTIIENSLAETIKQKQSKSELDFDIRRLSVGEIKQIKYLRSEIFTGK